MLTKVFYWKNINRCLTTEQNMPVIEDVDREYVEVCQMESADPEEIFARLNIEPGKFIGKLPQSINHISMSVGDVLLLPDGRYLVTMPMGFRRMKSEKERATYCPECSSYQEECSVDALEWDKPCSYFKPAAQAA